MSLITDIRTKLLADSAVLARVGDRIYNNRLPQNISNPALKQCAIVISTLDDQPVDAYDKQYSIKPSVEIIHFGPSHKVAEEMEAETRAVLEGYRGSLGSRNVTIMRIDSRDDLEPDLDIAMKVTEYRVWI
jgi:hypothetical protein